MLYIQSSNQISTSVDGEQMILNVEDGTYYGMNKVGKFIWDLLVTPAGIETLVRQVREVFDVSDAESRKDVTELVDALLAVKLVRALDDAQDP